ncbi:MAG TPA: ornithine cyclodeaminase family protein [Terriglobales bacterium]|nr:ornithine cyclodeaminase family protein [Terriglobales bacterium]
MHVLTEADVHRLLDPRSLIPAIQEAFRSRYPSTLMPTRTQMKVGDGVFLIMPCYDRVGHGLGMKMVKFNESPTVAEERVQATYILLDVESGCAKLVIPANYLTDARTAATSAVATSFLAREDAKVLGVFGTGREARAHLQILRHVRPFERALVTGRDTGRTREFAQQMEHELGMKVESVYSRTCAAESDVLCTCTTSKTPLFDGNMVRKGTHINAVGSFQPTTRELDDVCVRRSRIVVDTYDGALAEAGDLLIPLNSGIIRREHLLSDLHELTAGRKKIRTSPLEITLFKSVGNALEDLTAAELLEETVLALDRKPTDTPAQVSS